MRTIHKTLAAAAFAGLALSCSPQPSFAASPTATGSTHNWVWNFNGKTYGECDKGYTPQWNEIADAQHKVWATHSAGQSPYWTITDFSGAQAFLTAHPNDATSVAYPMNSDDFPGVPDQHETTHPVGYTPSATEDDEGDCVPDGQSLPAPNDNFHGNGTTYPLPTPKTVTTTKLVPVTVTKTAPHKGVAQHDRIRIQNAKQAAQINTLLKRQALPYRGDRLSWGHSTWGFTTSPKAVTTTSVKVGQVVDLYWWIDTKDGAKPVQKNGLAWGPKHNLAQTLVTKASLVDVTVVHTTKSVTTTSTAYICPDGSQVPTAATVCKAAPNN